MKLVEARVDLRGRLAAVGHLLHEPDSAGHFAPKAHNCIVISPFGTRLRLAAANATRDPLTNFMETDEVGRAVFLPPSVSAVIWDALEHGIGTAQMVLPRQEGELLSQTPPKEEWHQPLSDWHIELEENADALKVTISAALLATEPIPSWRKFAGNFWPSDNGESSKLLITFSVDHATRIAALGALIPDIVHEDDPEVPAIRKSTASDMNLANAQIAQTGYVLAFSQRGWISLVGSRSIIPTLSWAPFRPLERFASGLLSGRSEKPAVRLSGINMREVCDMVALGKAATIQLQDGKFGEVQWDARGEESMLPIRRALLKSWLSVAGLEFEYRLSSESPPECLPASVQSGSIQGHFTVSWEVLILRYSILAPYRSAFLPQVRPK